MYIETVRFERVFDVQSGTFSFEAGGKCEFAVVLDPPGGAPKGALLSAQAPWNPRAATACPAL